jgi:hypothetical protein
VIASNARCGPIPLRWAYGGSAGSVLRSLRKLWGGSAFALCARGWDNIIGPRDYEGIGRKNWENDGHELS